MGFRGILSHFEETQTFQNTEAVNVVLFLGPQWYCKSHCCKSSRSDQQIRVLSSHPGRDQSLNFIRGFEKWVDYLPIDAAVLKNHNQIYKNAFQSRNVALARQSITRYLVKIDDLWSSQDEEASVITSSIR